MPPSREAIFEIIRANVLKVLFELKPEQITPESRLADLGANSIDRVEVAMYSMEDLKLNLPRVELHGVENLGGLVEVFHRHLSAKSS